MYQPRDDGVQEGLHHQAAPGFVRCTHFLSPFSPCFFLFFILFHLQMFFWFFVVACLIR
jgi:hypothetical protein